MDADEGGEGSLERAAAAATAPAAAATTGSAVMVEQGPPDSWEMADLVDNLAGATLLKQEEHAASGGGLDGKSPGSDGKPGDGDGVVTRSVEQVDSFLREALQNPCDRLTILRLEQEVERFIRNPKLQQLDFQPMPSSYLRLAAHRVAQHYFLQSMVVDSGSMEGSRIIARKTGETRYPAIRLADIPVDLPAEEKFVSQPVAKVAIKQRPHRGGRALGDSIGGGGYGGRLNPSKSVEERKEEYNKARARIFCGENGGKGSDDEGLGLEPCQPVEPPVLVETAKPEERVYVEDARDTGARGLVENGAAGARSNGNGKVEKENSGRVKYSNRVAIFRDREKDRRDPDYDRNFDRYSQRFDPGFGVNVQPFGVQPIYAPLANYNTEFPQLGGIQRPPMVMDAPLPPPLPQHMRAPWGNPVASLGFRPGDAHMGPYNPGHIAPHSSVMYMAGPQYGYPGPNMGYMHPPHDHFQQPLTQPHQQQPDSGFSQAPCR